MYASDEQEVLTCSYGCTGWVWEITNLKFKTFRRITNPFRKTLWNMPQINEEKWEDQNMWPVGLGNTTRISTDYAWPKITLNNGCRICRYLQWRKASILTETSLDKIGVQLELLPDVTMFWIVVLNYTRNLPLHHLWYFMPLCIWDYTTL